MASETTARLSNSDSRRMYSWWWDSHISPKNSKWLQENLTDMDAKVKVMIKLIEEDADSFARRAEMYYKKRPELMKLVEEFYRAYRALAERYDHATGVIRHAHLTMSEVFPNQVPSFADDSPANSVSRIEPKTPETSIQNREFIDEPEFVARSQPSTYRVRRSLNFANAKEKEPSMSSNENDQRLPGTNNASDSNEILMLKEAISKLEVEKEAGFSQYQKSLDELSQLEAEIYQTQEELRALSDRATEAENEVISLKKSLSTLDTEKESKLQEYQQYLDRISDLQSTVASFRVNAKILDERACNAESRAQTLQDELNTFAVEKDAALSRYMESLDLISHLENKLRLTEEDARRLKGRAENAETEIEILKQTISKLENSNKSLRSELESLMSKMGTQTQELTEKQKELGRFWDCIQEERLHFVEAETDFQTLKHSHTQMQEDLRSMASELQKRAQLLKVAETRNHSLHEEVLQVKEENKHLDELNALSIKGMQKEISSLRESKGKLVKEFELILKERNALQQDIYHLKEELHNLEEENSNLKETCYNGIDKEALLEKLELIRQLLEKNSTLENSLCDLNDELEAVRWKIEALEETCESLSNEKCTLLDEKATLMTQLKETNKNLEKLSENNTVLVSSLSAARRQVEILKAKSKILEDSCQLLVNEKEALGSEKDGLTSLLDITRKRLEDLVKIYGKLQGRCKTLEKEKESALRKVEELQMSLDVQRQESSSYIHMNETRFSSIESEMKLLLQESQGRKRELDQVIDNAVDNEVEIIVLRLTAQELAKNNRCILVKNQNLLENLSLTENTISLLQKTKCEQEVQIKSLSDQLEFKVSTEQLMASQSEVLILLDQNEELRSKLREEDCNRETLMAHVEDLNRKLAEIHGTREVWQRENSETFSEKRSLTRKFLLLEENNNVLEEENYSLCSKVLALQNFSMILQSCTVEKLKVLREFSDNLNKLRDTNAALMERLSLAEAKSEESKTENLHIQERLQQLEDVATIKDQLSIEIENVKKLLHQMELQLQEVENKLSIAEKKKLELHGSVERLRMECTNAKMVQDSQEDQIFKMTADNDSLINENKCLYKAIQVKEVELHELHEECNERKIREVNLQYEVQTKTSTIHKLESEAASAFGQLQYSMVIEVLYEQKFRELHEACLGYIGQIEDLKNNLAAYGPEIECLKECVSSLEDHTGTHSKLQDPDNEDLQGAHVTKDAQKSILNDNPKASMPSTFSDLHDLRYRLQAIEKAAVEIKELTVHENFDLRSKLDAAMRKLDLIQHGSGRHRRNSKPTSEITEADNTVLTKDIMLDQVSDGSYNGFNKREPVDSENQIIELWETADPNGTIGLTVGKSKKTVSPSKFDKPDLHRVRSVKKQKGRFPIPDEQVDKELSIDKLEIYNRSYTPVQEGGNKRKILERLDSDVQKLANLQITVQDLRRKLAVTEKGKRGKAVLECEALKLQLEEADIAIMKLFDLNGRLTKSMEDGSSFIEIKSSFDLENDGSLRRRRVSEQARRVSEKIGRLQLEVQKFQFVLLKMDNEKGVKVNVPETRRRLLLRDFIYGGARPSQRRKKTQCCVCVQPSTNED